MHQIRMNHNTRKMVEAALFLALGLVFPFLTGQIPQIGKMLLPMHIPVLLCGFVCGWQYGVIVGFVVPLFRSILFGMPIMMPAAVGMAFELAVYGLVSGLLYRVLRGRRNPGAAVKGVPVLAGIYVTLVAAMIAGRIVWGIVSIFLYGVEGNVFSWKLFLGGALLNAVPGIVVQLVIIPVVVILLEKAGLMEENVG